MTSKFLILKGNNYNNVDVFHDTVFFLGIFTGIFRKYNFWLFKMRKISVNQKYQVQKVLVKLYVSMAQHLQKDFN